MACYYNTNCCTYPNCNYTTIYWGFTGASLASIENTEISSSGYTINEVITLKSIASNSTGTKIIGTKSETQTFWTDASGKFVNNEVNTIQISINNAGSLYFETNLRSSTAPSGTTTGSTKGRFDIISGTGLYLGKTGYVDYDSGNDRATIYLNPC